jgi:predicted dehydrogenase
VVATPDNQHFTVAEKALDAGKNVFIEKPVATTLEGLGGVSRLADHYPGKMLFSEKYSFATPVQSVLRYRQELGEFMTGSTSYVMWNCDRIMGGGKWRTEHEYNPAAGGLSHNFMTLLLFTGRRITEVCAVGQVLTYHENLDRYHGFDTMRGLLRFEGGTVISFDICLAIQGRKSPYAHRTVLHNLQFRNGGLAYGPDPSADHLVVGEEERPISPEKSEKDWGLYNIGQLYVSMWDNLIDSLLGKTKPLHTIEHGLNVAATCVQAFESAKQDGVWLRVPF